MSKTNSKKMHTKQQSNNEVHMDDINRCDYMSEMNKNIQNCMKINQELCEKIEHNYHKMNNISSKLFLQNLENAQHMMMCNNFQKFLEISEDIFQHNIFSMGQEMNKMLTETLNVTLKNVK